AVFRERRDLDVAEAADLHQLLRELVDALEALGRLAIARAQEPRVEPLRDVGDELARYGQRLDADLEDDVAEHLALERDPRRERGEGTCAERPDVRERVRSTADRELLGAHEVRR